MGKKGAWQTPSGAQGPLARLPVTAQGLPFTHSHHPLQRSTHTAKSCLTCGQDQASSSVYACAFSFSLVNVSAGSKGTAEDTEKSHSCPAV